MNPYSWIVYKRTYARWLDDVKRREDWSETVVRYFYYFIDRLNLGYLSENDQAELVKATQAVESMNVMPSMRCLWAAGPALDVENIAGYNCSYLAIDDPKAFAEVLYILMCGTGVGFSVERQEIAKLPAVPRHIPRVSLHEIRHLPEGLKAPTVVFEDSKQGWAEGYYKVLQYLYEGKRPICDLSKIRSKGAKLKTFGGRASGPEPLKQLIEFTINIFIGAEGRKLNSIECHDICCMIANCVIVGGTRRSATISLSNLTDQRMRHAKDGEFWKAHLHRTLSNNSVAYTEKPDMRIFMEEWMSLMASGNGERGIVNREGLRKAAVASGRASDYEYGVNPCGEVILRPKEFCNLTEVVVRSDDTKAKLLEKVTYATILGVLQSTLTDFKFIRPEWKVNVEEERLLGVSLTGVSDHPILSEVTAESKMLLFNLRCQAERTAQKWARLLGIKVPKAITCVKPSGTVSQLVNSASGLHTRFSPYYIRRIRIAATDPMVPFLKSQGVPNCPDVGQSPENATTYVFEFPVASPEGSKYNRTAIQQLEYWKMFKEFWCDHNPSVTISVDDHEWLEVGAWVYKNWDSIGGLAFLPKDGGVYPLPPYEAITEEEYLSRSEGFKTLDTDKLTSFDTEDTTEGAKEYACSGGACELT